MYIIRTNIIHEVKTKLTGNEFLEIKLNNEAKFSWFKLSLHKANSLHMTWKT